MVWLLGYRHLVRVGLVVFIIGTLLLPWCNAITGPIDALVNSSGSGNGKWNRNISSDFCGRLYSESSVNENSIVRLPAKVWAIVLLSFLMYEFSRSDLLFLISHNYIAIFYRLTCLVSMSVMVNNSSLSETKGTVNGIGQSLVAIFRSVGPTVGSLGFAWSEGNGEVTQGEIY